MLNNSLNDDDVKLEVIRLSKEKTYTQIANELGLNRFSVSKFLKHETFGGWWEKHKKPVADGNLYDHHHKMKTFKEKRFILTSAQNNTFVHDKFLKSLETMAERYYARILVGTYSYNVDGFQNLSKGEGDWFDPKIVPYIVDEPVKLAKGLLWCGELNILPTAVNPLSGFHSYTKDCSGILPHAKIQMESLPVFKGQYPKFLYTTGSVTKRNYIQKKAGQKASFHHIFGALFVEIDNDGDWYVRQLIGDTDTGEFYDLDTAYGPNGYDTDLTVEAINWGDIHAEKYDHEVAVASYGDVGDSMLNVLKPSYQFVHDVLDFEARNHHNINDPYFRFKSYIQNKDSVEKNIQDVIDILKMMNRDFSITTVVESNHDLALQKWLKTADYKTDPTNALFFLKCQLRSYQAMNEGDDNFSILEWLVEQDEYLKDEVQFLRTDESCVIAGYNGIECGQHGHNGISGTRGSIGAYQKIGLRANIGHSHSAGIKDGVYQAGVTGDISKFDYAKGPSTWSNSHIVTYRNSKRTIITIKNGKWRAV